MNHSGYGRRRMTSAVAMPMDYARRTANDGMCQSCETMPNDPVHANLALAMAYVLWQPWGDLYEVDEGFDRGTIYRDLDKPFIGGGTRCAL